MTKITAEMRASMHARRLEGESFAAIATSYGLEEMTVYQSLRRTYGLDIYKFADLKRAAANDNVPGRVRRMSPHNGGCSTLSGKMPVTLAEVGTLERAPVPMSAREMAAREMAVAA